MLASRTLPTTLLFGLAFSSMGCMGADPVGSEELSFRYNWTIQQTEARDDSPGGGLWVNNGVSDPNVGGIDPAYPLSSPLGLSETAGVLTDPQTRIAAEYLVECALPEGASIEKTVDGETIVLEGQLGLAPEWEDADCEEDCQEWVTACMLARTNVNAQTIQISLRADHPAIGLNAVPGYDVYEGSFYGNFFADPDAQYMCAGNEQQQVLSHLQGRTCSDSDTTCGFTLYEQCEVTDRCAFVEIDGGKVAGGCTADGDTTEFKTITVYLLDDAIDDDDQGEDDDDQD